MTTQRRHFLTLLPAASLLLFAAQSRADNAHGVPLVSWSKKLEERRYQSGRDFDGTVTYFEKAFKGGYAVTWQRAVSLPHLKFVHIKNRKTKAQKWSGINIYAEPGKHAHYYILPPHAKTA